MRFKLYVGGIMTKQEIKERILNLKTKEEIENFINERIYFLESISKESTVGQGYTDTFDGYISSKTHYKAVAALSNCESPDLVYDDIGPYVDLLTELSSEKSYLNELYLFTPLMFLIFNYMSRKENRENPNEPLIERSIIYFNAMSNGIEKISISKFHLNKSAFCSENSGLAQNVFKILGIDSQLVVGRINGENHAFNIVFPHGYGSIPAVLFDSSNQIDFIKDQEQTISMASFKVLTGEEYNDLFSVKGAYIDFGKSAETLKKYYPELEGFLPKYDNATYSIGGVPKTEDEQTSIMRFMKS